MYDISGSAHFINKCDNGIVIHRNRDPDAGPIDVVQVNFVHLFSVYSILMPFLTLFLSFLPGRMGGIIGLREEGTEQSDRANRRCFLDVRPVCTL